MKINNIEVEESADGKLSIELDIASQEFRFRSSSEIALWRNHVTVNPLKVGTTERLVATADEVIRAFRQRRPDDAKKYKPRLRDDDEYNI